MHNRTDLKYVQPYKVGHVLQVEINSEVKFEKIK